MIEQNFHQSQNQKIEKYNLTQKEIQQKLTAIIFKFYHFTPQIEDELESPRQIKSISKKQNERLKIQQKHPIQTIKQKLWKQIASEFNIPEEAIINMLYTNENLILFAIKYLSQLPYTESSKEIIFELIKKIDPSLRFLQSLIQPLITVLQNSGHELNLVTVIIVTLKILFEQQTPINSQLDSYIQIYGGQGIKCDQSLRWPFEKSGTITLWFNIFHKTQQCKLFQIKNGQGIGFQIVLKNGKFYFQKIIEQKKFRLMQNNSAYLCQCEWDKCVKLSIEFEIKKKFFQPIFSINVIMNNFVMTNIEVDSISYTLNDFKITMFKNYFGKFYSALILKSNLSGQVEELNSNKGFIYQNDIKNFAYIFENDVKNIVFLYSAIRTAVVYEYDSLTGNKNYDLLSSPKTGNSEKSSNVLEKEKLQFIQDSQSGNSEDSPEKVTSLPSIQPPEKQLTFLYPIRKPQYILLYDAVNRFNGKIIEKANRFQNVSIKKQMVNYGGLKTYIPLLNLLKNCASPYEEFKTLIKEYLLLIKFIFLNKTQSLEEAHKIQFFKILAHFFDQIKLQSFDQDIICTLKEVYVSLNTRMMRESFVKDLVWGIKTAVKLQQKGFEDFIKFIKTFYNEDIQSMLVSFGIHDIINFIIDNYDHPNCCFQHTRGSIDSNQDNRIKNYMSIVKLYFSLFQNILLVKRNEKQELEKLIKQILTIFTLNTSACFIQAFVLFLSELFSKDSLLEEIFLGVMNSQNYKLSIYMCLAYSYSWKTKTKLIELVLHVFGSTIIKQFCNQEKDQKHLISLCIKFPVIMHLPIRPSSIKSQERQYSIDQSEDKLSMNSTNLKRYTVMKTIDQQDIESLLNEEDIARVILEWSFSQQVVQKMEQNQNVGISILMEIYKGSTYKIRKYITNLLVLNQKLLSLGSAIMPSFVECLFVCEYDSEYYLNKDQIIYNQIIETKKNLLQLICTYKTDSDSNELPQLLILKLIIASVKSKFSSQVTRISNRIYLLISDEMFKRYLSDLKKQQWKEQQRFNMECQKIINNAYKTLVEYFCQRGQENELQFQQESIELAEKEYAIMISVLEKIFDLLIYITAPNVSSTIMNENNSKRNKFIATILFPQKKEHQVSFFSFIFVILQTIFENFEDLNISERKTILTLQKKYLIYFMQLTQNSHDLQLEPIEDELKNIFLIALAFLENKYYQYYFYGFEKHKHLQFSIEARIRKNIQDMRNMIFNVFLDLIEMIKQLDEIGSMEHKSFYELMKPKRKTSQKSTIKNFYPQLWKKTDDKIIQFMCLPSKILRQQAKQKLQTHLTQKRLSLVCSSIEKSLTKRIQMFINLQKKNKLTIEQKSVYSYMTRQSLKCKKLAETQQQITVIKYQYGRKQRQKQIKRKQNQQKRNRQINNIKRKLWNFNRCFSGLWKNNHFYKFCQNNTQLNQSKSNPGQISAMYRRVRSKRQSKYSLTPFIKVVAEMNTDEQKSFQQIYLNQMLSSRKQDIQKKDQSFKSQKYLKIGLAFIKKKVIQKIMKKGNITVIQQGDDEPVQDKFFTKGVIWVKPMLVSQVNIQLNEKYLVFYQQSSHSFQHLSLLKNQQKEDDLLMKQFKLKDIENYQVRTFMLKTTAVEIFFNNRKSVFISFYAKPQSTFYKFLEFLQKFKKFQIQDKIALPLKIFEPMKFQDHFVLTQKWVNREISNFQYIMSLNILSGRSNCDLNQYFVFPWILKYFNKKAQQFRDLSLNMGSLGSKERLDKFKDVKTNLQNCHKDQFPHAHNFGFHYSNIAIVLQYLIRVNPYSEGSQHLQGGKFDIPDRLFFSIVESYNNSINQMSDIRELIPEFYYFPQFLVNSERFDFGTQQNSNIVDDVQLPQGYKNSYEFIERHRQLFESEIVSQNLHQWIDLIFGYKQTGKQADLASNKFHYLAYESNFSYVSMHEEGNETRQALQSHMAYFGKVPSQIFTKPHPKRNVYEKSIIKQSSKIKNAEPFKSINSESNHQNLLIKHLNGCFSLSSQCPIFFYHSQQTKKYLTFRKNGQGIIFYLERSAKSSKQIVLHKPNTSLSLDQNFEILIDKQENMYIFDESLYFESLPITSFWCEQLIFGGLWGGRILKYDIKNQKFNLYDKHSETVTAVCSSEELQILLTGSLNGEVVIWTFQNKLYTNINNINTSTNNLSEPKLMFKEKMVPHLDKINDIQINTDLKVAIVSSQDGYVSILDVQRCEIIRKIQIGLCVLHSNLLNYPYYCLFIQCYGNKQYCYSLNGQLLNEYDFNSLWPQTKIIKIGHRQLIIIKQRNNPYFNMISLGSEKIDQKLPINKQDNDKGIINFMVSFNSNRIQILINTMDCIMINCTYPYEINYQQ